MREMSQALAGSAFVELPGAGHISNLDQPAAFTRAIEKFLAGD
jgi:3-oxoadipate enol-lactonase